MSAPDKNTMRDLLARRTITCDGHRTAEALAADRRLADYAPSLAAEVLRLRAERDVMEADLAAVRRIMGEASDRALRAEDAERLCAAALAHARDEAAYQRQAADALRAVIEGRTTPPTEAECAALAAARGAWLVLRRSTTGDYYSDVDSGPGAVLYDGATPCRWIALDAERRPCAWPVVQGGEQ